MSAWQTGHPDAISATRSVQLSQKRLCPHGTKTKPSRGATIRTSDQSSQSSGAAASADSVSDAADVVTVAVGA